MSDAAGDDRVGELTPEQIALGRELDSHHEAIAGSGGGCGECGFLTQRRNIEDTTMDGVWKHMPGEGELSKARTFLAG